MHIQHKLIVLIIRYILLVMPDFFFESLLEKEMLLKSSGKGKAEDPDPGYNFGRIRTKVFFSL